MVVEGTRGTNTAMAAMDEAVAAMRLSRVGERESYPQLRCFDFCVDYSRSVGSGFVHYRIILFLAGWTTHRASLESSTRGRIRLFNWRTLYLEIHL